MIESVRTHRGVTETERPQILGMYIGIEDHWVGGAKVCVDPERRQCPQVTLQPSNRTMSPSAHWSPNTGNWSIGP